MASYRQAITWIAQNDDTEWVNDAPYVGPSVTASLVADLFGKTDEQVVADLRRALNREAALRRRHEALVRMAMAS